VFPTGLNGAAIWSAGRALFVRGTEVIEFDVQAAKSTGRPQPIGSLLPGVFPHGIDAPVLWPGGVA
jgi:hypothetical protein